MSEADSSAGSRPAPHISRYRVTYRMTDQMGVVYYGHYLELFEIGRTEMLRDAGFEYRALERDGYYLPVVHVSADYLSPARYDDLLLIHTWLEHLGKVRFDFRYELCREGDDRALCRGRTRHVLVGADGRPRRLEGTWLERLKPFAAQSEDSGDSSPA
ncbi:MAG TPA: thioesterase family protein [Candidatus Sumerlaeota bacterium]|nr:MAG: 1,4-dihydroxy-2-naphthoyl-CoA hydrolase [candidate division BRC1 bacterium ADurb.BinA292]HOE96176.1 thioesterase family protein [Candidatus Sumerlaeota bacterium]